MKIRPSCCGPTYITITLCDLSYRILPKNTFPPFILIFMKGFEQWRRRNLIPCILILDREHPLTVVRNCGDCICTCHLHN